MNKKQQEALIEALNIIEDILIINSKPTSLTGDSRHVWIAERILKIVGAFINNTLAVKTKNLLYEAIYISNRESEIKESEKSKTGYLNISNKIIKKGEELKAQIENPEPLKVESGTYEITYNITGRGGASMELLEGEEVADILELYLLDTGMNLDDREVNITGIKKI